MSFLFIFNIIRFNHQYLKDLHLLKNLISINKYQWLYKKEFGISITMLQL